MSRSYNKNITGNGGSSPYSFIVSSGSLPPGLTLTSGGVLSGTPTSAGTFSFAIQARDRYGRLGTRQYNLAIAWPTISLSPSTLSNETAGFSYSKTITASGGRSPYSFIISSGSLPPGLTLTSSGFFSGTPTSAGSFTFEIQARDINGCLGTRQYVITVVWPTISLSPSTLPNGTVGHSYSKTITGKGGIGPYSFAISSGSLPAGLTLTSGGILSGKPTSAGTFFFTITATDKNGFIGTRSYSLALTP